MIDPYYISAHITDGGNIIALKCTKQNYIISKLVELLRKAQYLCNCKNFLMWPRKPITGESLHGYSENLSKPITINHPFKTLKYTLQ